MYPIIFLMAFANIVSSQVYFTPGKDMGPIKVCESDGQLIADIGSCTRFHRCRKITAEMFTTDIAICSFHKVFDMVTSECVDSDTHLFQDPESCSTFYGCHATKETSEGFIRSYYHCPGDLRFHPIAKFCTFKTDVTDDLCNSQIAVQRIIGDVEGGNTRYDQVLPSRLTSRPRPILTPSPPLDRINSKDDKPDSVILTRFSAIPVSFNKNKKEGVLVNSLRPQGDAIDKITQVISGQLLNIHGKQNNDEETVKRK